MTFPVQFKVGDHYFLLHTIAEWVGMFIGFRYFMWLRKRSTDNISDINRLIVMIGAMLGALIGSRIIGTLENIPGLLQATNKVWFIYNNKTVLGGLLIGLWTVELTKLIIKEKNPTGDLMVYPLILAMIIGRIGCFSMGVYEETYGNVSSFITGMNLGDNQLRHPLALYEIAFLFILWITLKKGFNSIIFVPGATFKIFIICYLIFRFFMETIKPSLRVIGCFSTIQIACIAGLIYYYRYLLNPSLLINRKN